jgi:hypothetical protein
MRAGSPGPRPAAREYEVVKDMSLADLIPSLRSSLRPPLAGGVWPTTAHWGERGDLFVGGAGLARVAAEHGTPTYVVDEADVRLRCRDYVAAFGRDAVAYTAKALFSRGIARWASEEALGLYVGSAGELRVARAAGFPASRIVMYGSAKTPEDLDAAYRGGVGTIVVESLGEITRLAATPRRVSGCCYGCSRDPSRWTGWTTGSVCGSAPARQRPPSRGSRPSRASSWSASTARSVTR